jgi:hypothetical protein
MNKLHHQLTSGEIVVLKKRIVPFSRSTPRCALDTPRLGAVYYTNLKVRRSLQTKYSVTAAAYKLLLAVIRS